MAFEDGECDLMSKLLPPLPKTNLDEEFFVLRKDGRPTNRPLSSLRQITKAAVQERRLQARKAAADAREKDREEKERRGQQQLANRSQGRVMQGRRIAPLFSTCF